MSELIYDPFDTETRRDPYPVYARLQEEAPLYRSALGSVVVSRFDDVHAILKNVEDFSSSPFGDLVANVDRMIVEEGVAEADGDEGEPLEVLIGTDPPRHTRLRKIVNRGFTRSRIATLEPRIREIAQDLVSDFADEGACEFVSDFGSPFPITVIAELLGVDPERRADFRRWSNATILAMTGQPEGDERGAAAQGVEELSRHIDDLIEQRRAQPRSDLVSALIRAGECEETMTGDEVHSFVMLLLIAGNETTANLLGNSLHLLCQRPDLVQALQERPERIPAFVEEMLRFDSPVQLTLRRANRDVEIAGGTIAAGSVATLLLGAANRDPAHFERPGEFDLTRFDATRSALDASAPSHLAFGFGHHFCLGAALARLETTLGIEALLSQLHNLELCEEEVEYTRSFLVRGPARLRIAFDPATARRVAV